MRQVYEYDESKRSSNAGTFVTDIASNDCSTPPYCKEKRIVAE